MYEKITLLDSNNNEIECSIIASWQYKENNYIAYTDGTKTEDKLDLYVSKYTKKDNNIKLIALTDDEWNYANKYLDTYLYEKEDK